MRDSSLQSGFTKKNSSGNDLRLSLLVPTVYALRLFRHVPMATTCVSVVVPMVNDFEGVVSHSHGNDLCASLVVPRAQVTSAAQMGLCPELVLLGLS